MAIVTNMGARHYEQREIDKLPASQRAKAQAEHDRKWDQYDRRAMDRLRVSEARRERKRARRRARIAELQAAGMSHLDAIRQAKRE